MNLHKGASLNYVP